MSDEVVEEGQMASAPPSEPNSAPQSPPNEEDDEQQEQGGADEEEGEGEEVDDNEVSDDGDDGGAPGDENGEELAEGTVGDGGDSRDATAQPQRQASSATGDQVSQGAPATSQPAKEKKARVRKWERKVVRIGHLQLLKWVPLEPREASAIERSEKLLKRQLADNAPVTRSTTAAYHQRVRLERRAATRTVSYRDQEEGESGDTGVDDEPAQSKRRRADDD